VSQENGGQGGILLLDRESGKAIAITLWSDEETMRHSGKPPRSIGAG
jgi:hypothetical protein